MKIFIAGSFTFTKEILGMKGKLEKLGHIVFAAEDLVIAVDEVDNTKDNFEAELEHSRKYDVLHDAFNKIQNSDALMVCNYDKKGVKGYIGTSVLMEIAVAYHFNKKIYFLFDFDKDQSYGMEMTLIDPIILQDNLKKISK